MTSRRRPAVLALLVAIGAAALAGASALTWWTQPHIDSLSGAISTEATGSQTDSLLIPVALIGLAGFGAALATSGALRRAVGGLLLLGGGAAASLSAAGLFRAPASLQTDLLRPVESSGVARLHAVGPLLGVFGGVLIAGTGLMVLLGYGARRGLGTRYDAPTKKKRTTVPADLDPAADADAAAGWWKALDAGQDPTGADSAGTPATSSSDASKAVPTRPPSRSDPGMSGDVSNAS